VTPEDQSLLNAVPESDRVINGMPDPDEIVARERAVQAVESVLRDLGVDGEVRVSPLGPGWSTDIDVYVSDLPSADHLKSLGWLPLNRFSRDPSARTRWGVTEGSHLLAAVDFHTGSPPDPVSAVLNRCRRRGEVRVREVLELRVLARTRETLPVDPIVELAADIERGLGGNDLARWSAETENGTKQAPAKLSAVGSFKTRLRQRMRKRIVIAVSGVDGAGKSTLAEAIATNLRRAGLDVTRVWARPGMEMKTVKALARGLKKLRGKESVSAVRSVARGETGGRVPRSRKGLVGWVWALLVTLSYVTKVRGEHRRGGRVVVYDRHLLDALVTLDFVYGSVNLSLQRAIVRTFVPKAAITLYLEIPAETAIARKESVVFGEHAVRQQLEHYQKRTGEVVNLVKLDATLPADELIDDALHLVTTGEKRNQRQQRLGDVGTKP
jgi:thymidylate kinase